MGIFSIIKNIAKPVTDIIDKAVVDKDLKKELKQEIELKLFEHAESLEKEITNRHGLDMRSDSWLSKNIRPMALIFITFVFVVITFADGNIGQFTVDKAYIPVYQALLMSIYIFYFGSRGFEKYRKIKNEKL